MQALDRLAAEVKSTEKIQETELKIKAAYILNKSIRRIFVCVYEFAKRNPKSENLF
jgi:hypothetical protein